MKRQRVAVAMSGGVDSSVAAALLKKQGYEVVGITLCFNLADSDRRRPACCSPRAIEDARKVAHKLGIRHYVLNMHKALQEHVIKDFCREYLSARTPNPCIRCNQYIKFGNLLKKALSLDARYLATGHYARIQELRSPHSALRKKRYLLKKARDKYRDQSYFLYRLNQSQLKNILFPLGNYSKSRVRELAAGFGLAVADKRGSQEICFLPGEDYREFLIKQVKVASRPGLIVDREGRILGRHKGIAFYTVGQREGLGIARGYPIYVCGIDRKKNQLLVGTREEAKKREFLINKVHFISGAPKKKVALKVKIRYNHKEVPAVITPEGRGFKVRLKQAQFAVTCGQSAVFYDGDTALGGGIIDKVTG